jgi:hypothetical protein
MSSVIGPGGGILPPFDGTLAPETVSPNIVEQLKSTGVADVIVILDTGADVQSISASRDAAIPTPASQLASELSHHFTRSELSPRGALASGERDLALGTPTTTEPAELLRVYDRLGVILGRHTPIKPCSPCSPSRRVSQTQTDVGYRALECTCALEPGALWNWHQSGASRHRSRRPTSSTERSDS